MSPITYYTAEQYLILNIYTNHLNQVKTSAMKPNTGYIHNTTCVTQLMANCQNSSTPEVLYMVTYTQNNSAIGLLDLLF